MLIQIFKVGQGDKSDKCSAHRKPFLKLLLSVFSVSSLPQADEPTRVRGLCRLSSMPSRAGKVRLRQRYITRKKCACIFKESAYISGANKVLRLFNVSSAFCPSLFWNSILFVQILKNDGFGQHAKAKKQMQKQIGFLAFLNHYVIEFKN
jgi:hypothetical protein